MTSLALLETSLLSRITSAIEARRYRFTDERVLQDGIAAVLTTSGIPFEREVLLSPVDRIDFLVGDVGIEIKIAHPRLALLRQLQRYGASERVGHLLVVTTKHRLTGLPTPLAGKPISSLLLTGSMF